MIGLFLAGQVPAQPVKIEFGWLGLIVPIASLAFLCIVRAFSAEDRVRRDCDDQIADVRDSTMSAEIRPTLGAIIAKIQPYMDWSQPGSFLPGEPGDPELEAARILGYRAATFSGPLTTLEEHYAKVHRARSTHGRCVAHAQRCGVAMGVFLIAWIYLGFRLSLPDVAFPAVLSIAAVTVLAGAGGWAAAEWWGSNREMNGLSVLARAARLLSGGETR